jgi:hypothetical protein
LIFYHGFVKLGGNHNVPSRVLCFNHGDDVAVDKLYNNLGLVASPFIVRPFAYGRGVGNHACHSFLAIPRFSCTLVAYLCSDSKVTIDKQRFTEEFIGIIRCV